MLNPVLPSPADPHVHALRSQWQQQLRSHRVIGVIRTADWQVGRQMAIAAAVGGVRLLEVTWNSDCPAQLVQALRADLPDCVIGAGTLRSAQDVAAAIAAQVQFAFMPHFQPALVAPLLAAQIPAIPGALTPTEIRAAWDFGATSVKVFPAGMVGGAAYIRAIAPVFEDVPLIPTGGVTLDNINDFLSAGAIAVGVSGCLFPNCPPVQHRARQPNVPRRNAPFQDLQAGDPPPEPSHLSNLVGDLDQYPPRFSEEEASPREHHNPSLTRDEIGRDRPPAITPLTALDQTLDQTLDLEQIQIQAQKLCQLTRSWRSS